MASNLDLFRHPDLLSNAKALVENLQVQIKLVEAFERGHSYLRNVTSNALKNCRCLTEAVQGCSETSKFYTEIAKLSTDELLFCSISFPDQRLKQVQPHFEATQVRAYMSSRGIALSEHTYEQISRRLYHYGRRHGSKLVDIFKLASKRPHESPKPTTQLQHASTSFTFEQASWENAAQVMGAALLGGLPFRPDDTVAGDTEHIRTRLRRSMQEDGIMNIEVKETEWLSRLFPGKGIGATVAEIEGIFGREIATAVENSQLREWEKQNGYTGRTNCVALAYCIQLRINSQMGFDLTKKLYSRS